MSAPKLWSEARESANCSALVLLAADRGQRRPGRPRGLQAFADGVAEDGMGADLQDDVVAVGGEAVDGGPEPHPFAYVFDQ
ncbi:hypothetical protein SMICM304S_01097 [Streptomyces microflavus]